MKVAKVGRTVVAMVMVAAVAVGCTPEGDPTRSPTPSPTPSVSQTSAESAEERQQRLDYEAAEKSYRAFRTEYNRVLRAGGAKEATAVMRQHAGGPYLRDFLEVVQAAEGLEDHDVGEEKVVYVRPSGYSNTSLLLDVCEDSRNVKTYDKTGALVSAGEIRTAQIEVRKQGTSWKLWSGRGKKVGSCT